MTSINNIQNMKWERTREQVWQWPMVSTAANVSINDLTNDNEMAWEWSPPKVDNDIVYHSYIPHLELPPPMWNAPMVHTSMVTPLTIDIGVDTWIEKENRNLFNGERSNHKECISGSRCKGNNKYTGVNIQE